MKKAIKIVTDQDEQLLKKGLSLLGYGQEELVLALQDSKEFFKLFLFEGCNHKEALRGTFFCIAEEELNYVLEGIEPPDYRKVKVKPQSVWFRILDFFGEDVKGWSIYYLVSFIILFTMAANLPVWGFPLITTTIPIPLGILIPGTVIFLNIAVCSLLVDDCYGRINKMYSWLTGIVLPVTWLASIVAYFT